MLPKTNKLINILIGLAYAFIYHFVYTNYMYVYFSYMYCPDPTPINSSLSLYLFLASSPLLFYKGFNTLASGLSFMVYLLMYIPMIYVTFITDISSSTQSGILISLYVFSITCFITDNKYLFKKKWLSQRRQKIPFRLLEVTTIILLMFVLIVEGKSLRFVNILSQSDLMYEMRASYSSSRLVITGYLISWLKTAFLPVLLVAYLHSKSRIKYILVLFAYLIMFMLDMQKITFVMPFVVTLVYFLAKKNSFNKFMHGSIIVFFSTLSLVLVSTINNRLSYSIAAIFIMRMQCLDSWIFSLYLKFFEDHPYTYYSHINFVNALTHSYPYKDALGVVVTEGGMNANASFLVTDGYAALGISGFFIIGSIFIVLKSVFNCIDLRYNRNYVLLTLFPAISSMLNVSLFTAIFSCGFLLLYIIYKYVNLSPLENPK